MLHATVIQLGDALTRLASVSPLHAKEQCINLHLCPVKEKGDTVTMTTYLLCPPQCGLFATRGLSVTRGFLSPSSKETQ